jgi:hypothetical protein
MKVIFSEELNQFKNSGQFSFKLFENLQDKCNAPSDQCGVYLIFKVELEMEELIYIGSCGQVKDGKLKIRKSGLGGIKDRLVNGYHPKFGKVKRKTAFPNQMKKENISELKFYWWVTYDSEKNELPTEVETKLRKKYFNVFNRLPDWHK